jgi:hypothetical protein
MFQKCVEAHVGLMLRGGNMSLQARKRGFMVISPCGTAK